MYKTVIEKKKAFKFGIPVYPPVGFKKICFVTIDMRSGLTGAISFPHGGEVDPRGTCGQTGGERLRRLSPVPSVGGNENGLFASGGELVTIYRSY